MQRYFKILDYKTMSDMVSACDPGIVDDTLIMVSTRDSRLSAINYRENKRETKLQVTA